MMLAKVEPAHDAEPARVEGAGKKASKHPGSPLSLVNRGFWVNMSNPKAIVFILAFMPQFIRPDQLQLPQYLILATTMIVIDIVVMWGGFAVVAKSLTRLSHSVRGQRALNLVFGSLFILVAAIMVLAGH